MTMDPKYVLRASGDDTGGPPENETGVATKPRTKVEKPPLFKVMLLNDDFTPMDFVVHVLQKFFHMSLDKATQVMLAVHQKGVGVCGLYTYEIAETKVRSVLAYAKKHEHPLQCTLEEE